jgi:hypothetical protein
MKSNKKSLYRKKRARDEVLLLHLTKPFKCGAHRSQKDYQRKAEKDRLKTQLQKDLLE